MKHIHTVLGITLLNLLLLTLNASGTPYISFDSNRTGNYDIYVIDTSGKNLRNLTNHLAYDANATWAPNGRAFAFVSDRDGNYEIYIMKLDGTEPRRLTNHPGLDRDPAWSPDGNWIAFRSRRDRAPNSDIYKIDINGENLQQLTDEGQYNVFPAWSPNGEQLAFGSRRKDIGGIYVMNADGKRLRRIMNPLGGGIPEWSPDGTQIAYQVGIMGSGIYIMNAADGQNSKRVTPNNIWSHNPAWSPDGYWIAYDAEIDNPWGNPNVDVNIYIVSVKGNKPRRITKHVGKDRNAAWVPEGFLDVFLTPEKLITQWSSLKKSAD